MACTKDGVRYPVEIAASMVRDPKGIPQMIVVVSRKTEERQVYESQLLVSKTNAAHIHELHQHRFLPALQGVVEKLGVMAAADRLEAHEIALAAKELRTAIDMAQETVGRLPTPENVSTLRPFAIAKAIDPWLPQLDLVALGKGLVTEFTRMPGGEEVQVVANEALPSLVARLMMELAESKSAPKVLEISVSSVRSSDIPGTAIRGGEGGREVTYGAITITGPGLRVSEAMMRDLRRKDLGTQGFAVAPASSVMETSRLVTFLYNGQVLVESPGDGRLQGPDYQVIVLVPAVG